MTIIVEIIKLIIQFILPSLLEALDAPNTAKDADPVDNALVDRLRRRVLEVKRGSGNSAAG